MMRAGCPARLALCAIVLCVLLALAVPAFATVNAETISPEFFSILRSGDETVSTWMRAFGAPVANYSFDRGSYWGLEWDEEPFVNAPIPPRNRYLEVRYPTDYQAVKVEFWNGDPDDSGVMQHVFDLRRDVPAEIVDPLPVSVTGPVSIAATPAVPVSFDTSFSIAGTMPVAVGSIGTLDADALDTLAVLAVAMAGGAFGVGVVAWNRR